MIRPVWLMLRFACLAWCLSFAMPAGAQGAESTPGPATALMRQMTGTWQVRSRMWPGPGMAAVDLPQSIARRELVRETYLGEVMEPAEASTGPAFTRTAYFSYNPINQQYEYFSLDTRLPQMMSYVAPGANKVRDGKVELAGNSFVAPQWGERKNVPFMYRLVVGPVENHRQVVQLFLTEQNGGGDEFLAFEYVYSPLIDQSDGGNQGGRN